MALGFNERSTKSRSNQRLEPQARAAGGSYGVGADIEASLDQGRRAMTGHGQTVALVAPNGTRLDALDCEILRRLKLDADIENQTLAEAVGLSPSGCFARVRRLEECGVIKGYVAVAEESIFAGWSLLWVKVRLRGRAHKRRAEFEEALHRAPEVMEAHDVAGRCDYLLKAALPSMSAWGDLRARLDPEDDYIKSVEIFSGLRTAKRRSPHPMLLFVGQT